MEEEEEIELLRSRVQNEAPARGSQNFAESLRFDDMPLSSRTKQGLHGGKLDVAKEIQAAAISHALCGRDILGKAKHHSRSF
jgi:ATP-dependent RNA helicase DDX10/DBP4